MFTPQPIGFMSSPYKRHEGDSKGLNAKHDVEGVLKILPEFDRGLPTSRAFRISSSSGSLIVRPGKNCGGRLAGIAAL